MRFGLTVLGVVLLAQMPLAAQHGAGHARLTGSHAAPAAASAGWGGALGMGNASFPRRLSATVSGRRPDLHVGTAGLGRNLIGYPKPMPPIRHPRRRVVPVVGYVPYYGYGSPVPQRVHVTVQNVPAPQPPVIINQYYQVPKGKPVVREYSGSDLPETRSRGMRHYQAPVPSHPTPAETRTPDGIPTVANADPETTEPVIYLIAHKDHSIYPAVSYWTEDGTVHFVTLQGERNQTPVEMIDEELSQQLNRERGVEFQLMAQ